MNRESAQKGAILVLVAVSMIVLLGLAALVIDVAYLYLTKNQLHVAADGAALAGAANLSGTPTDCTNSAARTEAKTFAAFHKAGSQSGQTDVTLDLNTANDPNGDIILGNFNRDNDPHFTPCPTGTPVNAVRVRARRNSESGAGINESNAPVSTFFASVLDPAFATSGVKTFATAIGGVRGDIPICISDCAFNSGCPTTGIQLQPDSAETAVWTSFFDDQNGYQRTEFYIDNPGSAPCITDEGKKIHLKNGDAGLFVELDTAINEEAGPVPVVLPVCDATCKTSNLCEAQGYGSGGGPTPGNFLPVIGSVVFTISQDTGGATGIRPPPPGNIKGIYGSFGSFTGPVSLKANCSGLVE